MNHIVSKRKRFIAFFLIVLCLLSTYSSITTFAKEKKPKLNVTSVTLLQGQSYTVHVYRLKQNYTVSFSIQDESIAYITKTTKNSCTFMTSSVGKTKLVAIVYNGNGKKIKTLRCSIRVTPPAVSVRFKKKKCSMKVGESISLRSLVTLKPANTAEVPVFATAADSNCLRVTPNGYATAVSPGKVTVIASIMNGKSDEMTIHIKKE